MASSNNPRKKVPCHSRQTDSQDKKYQEIASDYEDVSSPFNEIEEILSKNKELCHRNHEFVDLVDQ